MNLDRSTTIGRDQDNDIILDDDSVSRHHATLMSTKGRYYVRGLKSSNGTSVSGRMITDAELSDSDRIRFGTVELTFHAEGPDHRSGNSAFCTQCGNSIPLQGTACPNCGAPVRTYRLTNNAVPSTPASASSPPAADFAKLSTRAPNTQTNTLRVLIGLLFAILSAWYFFGGGLEKETADNFSRIQDQVAQDAVKQYGIASRNGNAMDKCVQAGFVVAAFLQAKDEASYRQWKSIQQNDCAQAGLPE